MQFSHYRSVAIIFCALLCSSSSRATGSHVPTESVDRAQFAQDAQSFHATIQQKMEALRFDSWSMRHKCRDAASMRFHVTMNDHGDILDVQPTGMASEDSETCQTAVEHELRRLAPLQPPNSLRHYVAREGINIDIPVVIKP